MKNMYIYFMTNKNNTSLYVGVTNNLVRRVYEHKNHLLDGFTAHYDLHKLVYYEIFEDEQTASQREKYLKKCYRKTKNKLVTQMNPEWEDLYDSIGGTEE